jgi:hypothetical protein
LPIQLINNVWPLQTECPRVDGNPGTAGWTQANLVTVPCPWQLFYEKQPVKGILINKRCADSLYRVLASVWEEVGQDQDEIEKLRYHLFSGSYNYRPMRGGSVLSMHAYGRAIDWDDADNPHRSSKHLFTDDSLLVVKFKNEGWEWGGDWHGSSIDAMHVQAARVH